MKILIYALVSPAFGQETQTAAADQQPTSPEWQEYMRNLGIQTVCSENHPECCYKIPLPNANGAMASMCDTCCCDLESAVDTYYENYPNENRMDIAQFELTPETPEIPSTNPYGFPSSASPTSFNGALPSANPISTPQAPTVYPDYTVYDGTNVDGLLNEMGLREGHSTYNVIGGADAAVNWYESGSQAQHSSTPLVNQFSTPSVSKMEYCKNPIYGGSPKEVCTAIREEKARVDANRDCIFVDDWVVKGLPAAQNGRAITFDTTATPFRWLE